MMIFVVWKELFFFVRYCVKYCRWLQYFKTFSSFLNLILHFLSVEKLKSSTGPSGHPYRPVMKLSILSLRLKSKSYKRCLIRLCLLMLSSSHLCLSTARAVRCSEFTSSHEHNWSRGWRLWEWRATCEWCISSELVGMGIVRIFNNYFRIFEVEIFGIILSHVYLKLKQI